MPILEITREQVEKAHRAREAALEKDPEYRAFEEETKNLASKAAKQREREETVSLTPTFELTPRRSRFSAPNTLGQLNLFGVSCAPKYNPTYRYSFDHMHAADEVLLMDSTAGDPSADYTDYSTRIRVPHVALDLVLTSYGAHKNLALIFGFDVVHESRVLIFTMAGQVGDETLVHGDRQFLIAVGSLQWPLHLYFVHATKAGYSGGGNWFFQGITGYVI